MPLTIPKHFEAKVIMHIFILRVLDLLRGNQFRAAEKEMMEDYNSVESDLDGWIGSYQFFIEAEMERLSGDYEPASDGLISSFMHRQMCKGISMNHLERLDGLLALQRVSQYNRNLNASFKISESANYQAHREVHSVWKDELRSRAF